MFIEINGIPTNINTITNFKKTIEPRTNADGTLQIYYIINYVKSNAAVDIEQFTNEADCNKRYQEISNLLIVKPVIDVESYINKLQCKIDDIDTCINKLVLVQPVVSNTETSTTKSETTDTETTTNSTENTTTDNTEKSGTSSETNTASETSTSSDASTSTSEDTVNQESTSTTNETSTQTSTDTTTESPTVKNN